MGRIYYRKFSDSQGGKRKISQTRLPAEGRLIREISELPPGEAVNVLFYEKNFPMASPLQ